MNIHMNEPYGNCPVLETKSFMLRLVTEDDAQDLLVCYSDPKSQEIFDSENCTSDFRYHTAQEVLECIRYWLREYAQKAYVRFAVVDKQNQKAIGTVEMFNSKGFLDDFDGGILRIDLASRYETTAYISEILSLADERFYDLFSAELIVTKGRPAETSRVNALIAAGYKPYDWNNPDRKHYYGRVK